MSGRGSNKMYKGEVMTRKVYLILISFLLTSFYSPLTLLAQIEPELVIPIGHTGPISSVKFSHNGEYLLTTSDDKTVKIWNSKSGKLLKTFFGHKQLVWDAIWSHDDKIISSISKDYLIIWEASSGEIIKRYNIYSLYSNIEWGLNEKDILIYSDYFSYQVLNLSSGELSAYKQTINYSSDSTYSIKLNYSDLIVKNVSLNKELFTFHGHSKKINFAEFSPDNKQVVTASKDKTAFILNVPSGGIEHILHHTSEVESAHWSPSGDRVATCSKDKAVTIWNVKSGKAVKELKIEGGAIFSVIWSSDGKRIATVCSGYTAKVWDSETGSIICSLTGVTSPIDNIQLSSTRNNVFILSKYQNIIKNWDMKTAKIISTIQCRSDLPSARGYALSPNGNKYATGDGEWNNDLNIWKINGEKLFGDLNNNNSEFIYIDWSHNSNKILTTCRDYTASIWDLNNGKLIQTFDEPNDDYRDEGGDPYITIACWSPDETKIATSDDCSRVKIWDSKTGILLWTSYFTRITNKFCWSPDGTKIISSYGDTTKILDVKNFDVIDFTVHPNVLVNDLFWTPDGEKILLVTEDNTVKIWNPKSRKITNHFSLGLYSSYFIDSSSNIIYSIFNSKIKLNNLNTGTELLQLIPLDSTNFVIVHPNGYFDGTPGAFEKMYYVKGLEVIPLESLFEKYYTPNLWERVMAGEQFEKPDINIENLSLPPKVTITKPFNKFKSDSKQVTVNVKVTDQGGGIDEIRLYLNGKLIKNTHRGFKTIAEPDEVITKAFRITLTNGDNIIKATAFNNQRTESIPDEVTINYDGIKKTANLHLLVIGIDNYKNSKYNLNYAIADALAFKKEIELNSSNMFNNIHTVFIKDKDATRENILKEFENLKSNTGQEDVFIFYYAGHGVMSMDYKSQFYIVPYDVTSLYGNVEMLQTKGISESELQKFSKDLKAQKQLYVFDACQSGGITEFLASRGAAEEKALAQLARSTGTYWLAASGSEQFATEFAELGHGLFTYCVLLGLQGHADGGNKDNKITVKELSSFLDDKVPELSEKYKGTSQYPSLYGYGMDFPIVIVK